MEFYTTFTRKRPIRLSEKTRQFAWESLHGRYGDETMQVLDVCMDDIPHFYTMTEHQKYDAAIAGIAATAPLRICENELVSGAATLGRAIWHSVPATFHGDTLWSSVSHVTLGFDEVVRSGVNAIERKITERLSDKSLSASQSEILKIGRASCRGIV